jgi:diaminohydroxyphosphoribosylaminopyrimidine deaminase/5-amino-6-(5-phosphoribosylamino)uracil reductase
MSSALSLAKRGLGQTWPNPTVACVIVKDNCVVGRGRTGRGGRPHAEIQALSMAGHQAQGAVAYVTLEPCSHHGHTPPCCDALIQSGLSKVVIAIEDPDPRVSGRGIKALQNHGIEVVTFCLSLQAMEVNAGFFKRIHDQRPLITLKIATSLDGQIATYSGESRWISGSESRHQTHLLRAEHDAIMIGIGTLLADDPELSCRLQGRELDSPMRIIIDSHLRTPLTSKIAQSIKTLPSWIVCLEEVPSKLCDDYRDHGFEIIQTTKLENGRVNLIEACQKIGGKGVTRLLVEGGSNLSSSLLQHNLIDHLAWFHAPMIIGGDGIPSFSPLFFESLSQIPRYRPITSNLYGHDVFTTMIQDKK